MTAAELVIFDHVYLHYVTAGNFAPAHAANNATMVVVQRRISLLELELAKVKK